MTASVMVDLAEEVVREYLPAGSATEVLSGGSANLMIAVTDQNVRYIIRCYLQDDPARFSVELQTLRALEVLGAPSPRVRRYGYRCAVTGMPYLVYGMLPGVTLAEAAKDVRVPQLGAMIGLAARTATACALRLPVASHGYLHLFEHTASAPECFHDIDHYEAVIGRHGLLGVEELETAGRFARRHLGLLVTNSPKLIHPDLKPENVLVDGSRISLIDWELPVGGHPLLVYGGLLAEGLAVPALRKAIELHISRLKGQTLHAVLAAGLLRSLEALSYLPANPPVHAGRAVRLDENALAESVHVLTTWLAR